MYLPPYVRMIHGTAFPPAPVETELFYRDDLHDWYIFDGTFWVNLGNPSIIIHDNTWHNPNFATEAALNAHIALTAVGIHGSTVAATFNRVVHRDGAGRAKIANPAVAADLDNLGARNTAIETHRTTAVHIQLQPPVDHTHQAAGGGVGGKLDHGLALNGLLHDDHPQYIRHALATAVSDFLVASGAGTFIKQTLAQVRTLLNWAADIAAHAGLTTGTHGVGAGSVVGTALTQILTNKRNKPRVSSAASGHISPSVVAADIYIRTAQAAALTIYNPTGFPAQGEKLIIRLEDNGTGRAITFGAQYRALEFALPVTTVAGKLIYMGFMFNSTDTKWDMVAINEEG